MYVYIQYIHKYINVCLHSRYESHVRIYREAPDLTELKSVYGKRL